LVVPPPLPPLLVVLLLLATLVAGAIFTSPLPQPANAASKVHPATKCRSVIDRLPQVGGLVSEAARRAGSLRACLSYKRMRTPLQFRERKVTVV
jgi:hypothetical protein